MLHASALRYTKRGLTSNECGNQVSVSLKKAEEVEEVVEQVERDREQNDDTMMATAGSWRAGEPGFDGNLPKPGAQLAERFEK